MPNIAKTIIIYGNNTKNHESVLNPFVHNHPNINVHPNANNNLNATIINLTPLNKAKIEEITAIAK
jgi:hypothetical protein